MKALFYHDIKMLLKGKKFFVFLLFLLCFLAAAWLWKDKKESGKAEWIYIGVINYDNSIYSQMLIEFFQENAVFRSYVSLSFGEKEEINHQFEEGILDMYLVIPEDFAQSMVHLEHKPVEAVISTRNFATQILLENLLQGYKNYISAVEINCVALYDIMLDSGMARQEANKVNDRISIQLILQALDKDSFFERNVISDYKAAGLGSYYLRVVLFLVLAYSALLAGVNFQKEHHDGIIRRLLSMGSSAFSILLEKQIFYSLVLTAAVFLVWGLLKGLGIFIDAAVICFICLAGFLLCAGMLFMAALFQKQKSYLLASSLYLLFITILGGGLIPFMYLPDRMLLLAKLTPVFWFLKTVFQVETGKISEHAGLFAIVLAGLAILLLLLAAYLCRRKEESVYENA